MSTPSINPYVGPRTFTAAQSHLFFGREAEAAQLLAVVISERLTLFYAQSGAGKSSLLHARLIPNLKAAGILTLPVGRVSGQLPPGVEQVDNIFAFNLMLSLDNGQGAPNRFSRVSLSHFLARLTSRDGRSFFYDEQANPAAANPAQAPDYVLIIDQFEEILTSHTERWPERADFFRQLDQVMAADPLLRVVLTLREDYVASLDPYSQLLAGKLRARFYMQRMGCPAALEAVKNPAQTCGRPFAPGVAESLVDNLRQIKAQGQAEMQLGQYVEPVQLQVVCYQLWENLTTKDLPGFKNLEGLAGLSPQITAADLDSLGNVDTALAEFYEGTLRQTLTWFSQKTPPPNPPRNGEGSNDLPPSSKEERGPGGEVLSELTLRRWFNDELITEAGTRGVVFQGPQDTAGLPNEVIKRLADHYLLRAEIRAGGTWYELVHDRFVEPIQQANRIWHEQRLYQSPLIQAAQAWADAGRPEERLYRDQQLQDALATFDPQQQEPLVVEFLRISEEMQRKRELVAAVQQTKRLRQSAVGLGIVLLFALAAAIFGFWQWQSADKARTKLQTTAEELQRKTEETQAFSLAAAANRALDDNNKSDLGLLLAIEAVKATYETTQPRLIEEAEQAIYRATGQPIHDYSSPIYSLVSPVFSPDSRYLAMVDNQQIIIQDIISNTTITFTAFITPVTSLDYFFSIVLVPSLQVGDELGLPTAIEAPPLGLPTAVAVDELGLPIVIEAPPVVPAPPPPLAGDELGLPTAIESPFVVPVVPPPTADKLGVPLSSPIINLAFNRAGTHLTTISIDGQVGVWDIASKTQISTAVLPEFKDIRYVVKYLAGIEGDGTAKIWSLLSNTVALTNKSQINDIAFSPDGSHLAVAYSDSAAEVWQVRGDHQITRSVTLAESLTGVKDVTFNASGELLATVDTYGTVRILKSDTGDLVNALSQPGQDIIGVAFNNEKTEKARLVTFAKDGTLKFWEIKSERELFSLPNDEYRTGEATFFSMDGKPISTSALGGIFSPNDKYFVTHDVSRVTLYSLTADRVLETACRMASRNMEQSEWENYMQPAGTNLLYRPTCSNLPIPNSVLRDYVQRGQLEQAKELVAPPQFVEALVDVSEQYLLQGNKEGASRLLDDATSLAQQTEDLYMLTLVCSAGVKDICERRQVIAQKKNLLSHIVLPSGENPYIYGLFDRGGERLMRADNRHAQGWVVVTEEIRANPNDRGGGNYSDLADLGFGVIVRLVHAYGSDGTLPLPEKCPDFAQRAANFVENAPGAHIWVIGNEMNDEREQPRKPESYRAEPITPRYYAECYKQVRKAIKDLPGHKNDQVIVGPIGPWRSDTPYEADPKGKYPANKIDGGPAGYPNFGFFGDYIHYLRDLLLAIGPENCDGIAMHAYTHGIDPDLIFSDQKMGPPFDKYNYHFRTYRDQMNIIPTEFRHLPVYLTEMNPDDAWDDSNSGWVRNAYKEIDDWNKAGNQQIRAAVLYRWATHDKWSIEGKKGVYADFRQAIENYYKWISPADNSVQPDTIGETNIPSDDSTLPDERQKVNTDLNQWTSPINNTMMMGLNIDPSNPSGNPDPTELQQLGVKTVRFFYYDSSDDLEPDQAKLDFYKQKVEAYANAGITSLIVLNYDTYPGKPAPDASDAKWNAYIDLFSQRAGQIATELAPWQPAFQVWNEPDHPVSGDYSPTLREAVYGRMLRRTYDTIKAVDRNLSVVAAGLAIGHPRWLTRVIESQGGDLPADVIAFHPYGQRPEPDWPNSNWGFGYIGDLLEGYYKAGQNKPIWITEMGVREADLGNDLLVAEFLRRYYQTMNTHYADKVQILFWFAYSDGIVPPFGLVDINGQRKPAYQAYQEAAGVSSTSGQK